MRKFGIKYSRLHPEHEQVRTDFVQVKRPGAWREVLKKWYCLDGPGITLPVDEPKPLLE